MQHGYIHSSGLTSNERVRAASDNKYNQCNIREWEHIVLISWGNYHSAGLTKEESVVAAELMIGKTYIKNRTPWRPIAF